MGGLLPGTLFFESIQLGLFFSPDTFFKSISMANDISNEFSEFFTDEPNVINLPPNAPIEIPRIIFEQPDFGQLNIGLSRADLIIKNRDEESWESYTLELGKRLSQFFVEKYRIRIQRIGLVLTCKFANDILFEDVIKKYTSSERLTESEELELSWRRGLTLETLEVNRWVRIFLTKEPGDNRKIIVDMNTIHEKIIDTNIHPIDFILEVLLKNTRSEIINAIE